MIQSIAATAKLMTLVLVALFKDGTLDTQSFVGPDDLDGCKASAAEVATEWMQQKPGQILAIMPSCTEIDDPRELFEQYMKAHPEVPASPPPVHIPGDHDA